jgi:hypothetical protein
LIRAAGRSGSRQRSLLFADHEDEAVKA